MLVDYVRVYAPTNLPAGRTNLLSNPGFEASGLAGWTTYGNGHNTATATVTNSPVYNGTNVFRVSGQFSGADNYSGAFQDLSVSPGQFFSADGWMLIPGNSLIAGANTAWIEVSFRDAASNLLSLYRSTPVTASTPPGLWLNYAVTNQFNPTTYAANGSVLFDDVRLTRAGASAVPVPLKASRTGTALNLTFPTYLNLPYQLTWKASLTAPQWSLLTQLSGDGTPQTVTVSLPAPTRFYSVARIAE